MEFGRVSPAELEDIDFKLPAEPAYNSSILPGTPNAAPLLFTGCAKWGRREWIGKIYPPGTPETRFLDEYVHHYNSIELNATHYKVYDADTIGRWAKKARGLHFRFCPKIPQTISHYSNLLNAGRTTTKFLEGILAFGEHLGPIFLQLSDRFSPKRRDQLYQYIATLPTDLSFFVEVRHPDWFLDEGIRTELFDQLHQHHIGAVITDAAGRRDCLHMHLTVPKVFIRFVGNSLHPTDFTRVDDWANRIKYWLDKGLEEAYFFMHMHDEATSPELSAYLADKLEAVCGIPLIHPKFVKKETVNAIANKGPADKKSATVKKTSGKAGTVPKATAGKLAKTATVKKTPKAATGKTTTAKKAVKKTTAVKKAVTKKTTAKSPKAAVVKKMPKAVTTAPKTATIKKAAQKKAATAPKRTTKRATATGRRATTAANKKTSAKKPD